jgi:hypothetical protein
MTKKNKTSTYPIKAFAFLIQPVAGLIDASAHVVAIGILDALRTINVDTVVVLS